MPATTRLCLGLLGIRAGTRWSRESRGALRGERAVSHTGRADLIELLGDTDGQVRYSAASALKRLTKQTLGHEPKEWREKSPADLKDARAAWRTWWLKNKQRFPDTSLAIP